MFLAPEEHDDLAKTFRPVNDGCSVYMYGETRPGIWTQLMATYLPSPFPLTLFLDDDPAISLINSEGFLHWLTSGGQHEIKIVESDENNRESRVSELNCQQGAIVFIEYSNRRNGTDVYFGPVEDNKGRREIRSRRLVVMDM